MAKNYVQEGEVIDFVAAAAVLAGAVVVMGKRIGISLSDTAQGATGAAAVEGVFKLNKLAGDVVGQGDLLYWDAANTRLTTTAGGNTLAGYAFAAAAGGVAVVNIKINA